MSNSNKSKKNNSIGSILGLNKLRNTTRKLGSSIESGLKSAKNGITGTVDKASNNIMPDFIEDSINGGCDDEAIEALQLVGTNFNWFASIKTDDTN